MNLFRLGPFKLHAGFTSFWKIDCDALCWDDWRALELMAIEVLGTTRFRRTVGVPKGGMALAGFLNPYCKDVAGLPTLIVDDVLTTGTSMEAVKAECIAKGDAGPFVGLVVFARGKCPDWVTPIFQMRCPND